MFKYALNIVFRSKLRTFLTSLGVTISVVLLSLIIFGMNGLTDTLVNEFSSRFKPNQIAVTRTDAFGALGGETVEAEEEQREPAVLDNTFVEIVESYPEVERVDAVVLVQGLQANIQGQDTNALTTVIAGGISDPIGNEIFFETNPSSGELAPGTVLVGDVVIEYFGLNIDNLKGKEIILTPSDALSFGTNLSQFKDAIDKEYTFQIAGYANSGGADRFDIVFDLDDAVTLVADFGGFENKDEVISLSGYQQILVTLEDDEQVDNVSERIEDEFGVSTITGSDIIETLKRITQLLTYALIFFATVSASVATIGIINTMVMSIYEQTREIGIIKAIGASDFQVLVVFLTQASFIGLLGGVVGLLIVFGTLGIVNPIVVDALQAQGFQLETFFSVDPVAISIILLSSVLVGLIAGVYPAWRAARLDPVKALRYE